MSVVGLCNAQQAANFEVMELKTTLEASARQINELKAQNTSLQQSLAAANAEAGAAREACEKMRGALEGLGAGAIDGNTDAVRERLLTALSDMRLLDDQKKKATEALLTLTEAAMGYAKAAPTADAATSKKLEDAVSKAELAVRSASAAGSNDAPAADLHNAKIVSVKPELKIAVLNVGSKDGVRAGMPFAIYREDHSIAKVLVVDVRKAVAGAVIQEIAAAGDTVKVGDRGMIDAQRSF
jgi:chromosome segregation ATPase